ncbi:MAG: formate dehydrogenase accessory sulfurtransferase FdhD [Candidatus Subteraquimicrobiales bacterium]|nr:formate dehydrogenase accessory sulfurtransferase FdhD [Candidatus Subteraquimicrobiales bacterium]
MGTEKKFSAIKYDGNIEKVSLKAPEEKSITLILNGEELVTLMATPVNLKELAIGFLYAEGFIEGITSLKNILTNERRGIVKIETSSIFSKPKRKILTSGFGKGVTFSNPLEERDLKPVAFSKVFSAKGIVNLMAKFLHSTEIHRSTGGVHCSALLSENEIFTIQEDIGRHNTIDKVLGYILLNAIPLEDKMVFTTGRISSEMLYKAIKANIPLVASHSTPTDASIQLGKKFGVSIVGYVRGGKMYIYTHPERIKINED